MKCICCNFKRSGVMGSKCDRCFLGWNECCPFTESLEKAITDSFQDYTESLGYYKAPFTNPIWLAKIREIEALRQ